MTTQDTRNILRLFAAFAASAVMLTLAQPPIGLWPLAWVAYVPFILACSSSQQEKKGSAPFFIVAYVVGSFYWLGNLYWISYVTVGGWISFCLYTAILWPILALCLRWCINKKIPLVVAVPILIVGIEQSQGLFLGGFYWHHLAHSQYANTTLIQTADIFGAAGVSFLVAMVNGLVAEVIISAKNLEFRIQNSERSRIKSFPYFSILIVVAAVAGILVYGKWRIEQSDKYITTGPMVAAVQTNIPQAVKQSFAAEEQIFDELLSNNKQCTAAGAKLIVWPETMVQAILEPQVLRLIGDSHSYKLFDRAISEQALAPYDAGQAGKGSYILVGAYGGSPRIENNFDIRMAQKYNAAFLYKPDGNQTSEKYYKIHLVPFGEYIPFKQTVPFLHKLLLTFTPYDFDYTLDAGTEFTAFEMQSPTVSRTYKFSVMICYEDAVPAMARRFVLDEKGGKRIDWLVNISNDGWFVRFKNDRVFASSELAQHTAICALRAVENRLAVIRSVNTGISCLIDTLGRIRDGYRAGNLPQRAFDRSGVTGWFADTIPIDSRITFFSKYGQWLDLSCQLCVVAIIIAQIAERFINRKAAKLK